MANRNYASGGKIYSMHVKPVLIDCSFTVAATNGIGITNLKGPLVQNVFMHTSTTPAAGNVNPSTPNIAITNPNPANGYIVIQLQEQYQRILGMEYSIQSPNSGSDVKIDNSAMTAGVAYVITTLGNATAAKWAAIGVPAGVTPAVGVSFIAASNGGAGNTLTSRVQTAAVDGSGVDDIEIVGNPDVSIAPSILAQGFGSQIILACRSSLVTMASYTPAGTNDGGTPPIFTGTPATLTGTVSGAVAAPAAGSVIRLQLYVSDSSVIVAGNSAT